jgi:hypothetical protein
MLSLPKGAPVATGVPATRDSIPAFLGRLAQAGFTGYARYSFAASLCVLLYSGGKLISVMLTRGGARLAGLEALTELCQRVATEDGVVDVYRLSPDLVMALHGLLHGEAMVRGQEIKLMDVRALTAQLKAQRFNGCLRVYTSTRTSLVFYKDGLGFGFFHDGSEAMETTATESQKIANLPGAKMDVLATRPTEQLQAYDILEVVNLQKVWDATVRSRQADFEKLRAQADEAERLRMESRLAAVEERWKRSAGELLGGLGKNLVHKELADHGGHACLLKPEQVAAVLAGIERGAKLVAGPTKVKDLIDRLRRELETHLAGGPP